MPAIAVAVTRARGGQGQTGWPIGAGMVHHGINIAITVLVAIVIITVLGGIGSTIASQFSYSTSNPVGNATNTVVKALQSGMSFLGPVILVGFAALVLLVLVLLARMMGT